MTVSINHQKLRILAIVAVVFLCALAGSRYVTVSRKKTQQVLVVDDGHSSSLHAYMAEVFWNHCGMDLINMNKAIEGLEQCKPGETDCAIQNFDSETIRKATKFLHPSMKESLRDCIVRKNLPVLVSGDEAQSDNWYLKYLESILHGSGVPRRFLASEPAVSLSAPTSAPSPLVPDSPPSLPPSMPPSVSFFPPSKDPSVQITPIGDPPTSSKPGSGKSKSNNTFRAVAIAVGVTVPATLLITALVMLCVFKLCYGGYALRRNDKRQELPIGPDLSNRDRRNGRVADQTNHVSSSARDLYPHTSFSEGSHPSRFRSDGTSDIQLSAESHGTSSSIAANALPPRPPMTEPISVIPQPPGPPPALPVVKPVTAAPKPPGPPAPPPMAKPITAAPKPPPPPMAKPVSVTAAPKPPGPPPPPPVVKPVTAAPKPPGPPPPPPMVKPVAAAPKPPGAPALPPKPPVGPPGPRPPLPPRSGPAPPRPPPSTASGPRPPVAPSHSDGLESESSAPKAKLKPFFWDKVLANSDSDSSMVWHQIRAGSFQFNEEEIETMFGSAPVGKKNERRSESAARDPPIHYIKLIDSRKAQNISILLKALDLTTEEVCDALIEGCEIPSEIFQTLLKMAPTQEEEVKLRASSGDISLLGPAERFLKALVDIPFAFKRIECLIFASSIQEEVSATKQSFTTLEVACKELRSSRLFLKLLEAVLKTGNRMNDGTFRGGAQAFKLDTLLKLADVKGTDGKTTLLHFVVQEIIRSEGIRAARAAREGTDSSSSSIKFENNPEAVEDNSEDHLRKLGLEVVSHLSSELENVKKAAALDADSLVASVTRLRNSLNKTRAFLNSDMKNLTEESGFLETLKDFVQNAEVDVESLVEEEKRIMASVRSVESYFHGSTGKDEGLHLFGIVRDFLIMVDKVCKEVKSSHSKPVHTTKAVSVSSGSSITSDQTQQEPAAILDMRQRLFPAIADRRIDTSSSDDEA